MLARILGATHQLLDLLPKSLQLCIPVCLCCRSWRHAPSHACLLREIAARAFLTWHQRELPACHGAGMGILGLLCACRPSADRAVIAHVGALVQVSGLSAVVWLSGLGPMLRIACSRWRGLIALSL